MTESKKHHTDRSCLTHVRAESVVWRESGKSRVGAWLARVKNGDNLGVGEAFI